MSRFEFSLNQKLAENLTEIEQAIVTLRLSAYKARKGDLLKARELIENIRERFYATHDAELFGYINFAEAICEYFEGKVNDAIIKIQRSRALCLGISTENQLSALVFAWEANFFRVLKDWKNVEVCLVGAFGRAKTLSSEASCRANLVLADCFQEVEMYDLADRYYSRSRVAALEYGDESMIGAILYNRAAIHVFNLRLNEISNESINLDDCKVAIEAVSAENYSTYTSDASLPGIYDLLSGQLSLLKGDFAIAIQKLGELSSQALGQQWPAVELVRRADILRARAVVGTISIEEARIDANYILTKYSSISNQGAVAVAANSLFKIFHDAEDEVTVQLREVALEAHSRYEEDREIQRRMLQRLIAAIELS